MRGALRALSGAPTPCYNCFVRASSLRRLAASLRKDLASGVPRSVAWGRVLTHPAARGVPPLRRLLRRFLRDVRLFEAFVRRRAAEAASEAISRVGPLAASRSHDRTMAATPLAAPPEKFAPRPPSGPHRGRPRATAGPFRCGCPAEADHRDPLVRRRCLFRQAQRARVRKSWRNYPTLELRRARTAAAVAARRARLDRAALGSVHPRVRRLLGSRVVLERTGRRPARTPAGGNQ